MILQALLPLRPEPPVRIEPPRVWKDILVGVNGKCRRAERGSGRDEVIAVLQGFLGADSSITPRETECEAISFITHRGQISQWLELGDGGIGAEGAELGTELRHHRRIGEEVEMGDADYLGCCIGC